METIEKAYNELVLRNHTWVDPELRKFDNPNFSDSHFFVVFEDFEEICSTPYVRIVYVRRWFQSSSCKKFYVSCQLL